MKTAVICAFPANLNPGMLSVDLAFHEIRERLEDVSEIVFFCAEEEFAITVGNVNLSYEMLRTQAQLRDFDLIVYWGDFLHWIGYFKRDLLVRARQREPGKSTQNILDMWYELFFLENAPELQKRAVVFGGTLYGLNAVQLLDQRYCAALRHLYGNARLVLMRDALSAGIVSQLVPDSQASLGCDCAMLLDSDKLLTGLVKAERPSLGRYMVCSFFRSQSVFALSTLAKYLASTAGLRLTGMNWLDKTGASGLIEKIRLLRDAEYVLTDIYHLALSCLREHIPVLCFGRAASNVESTLSDKKKEILFRQSFASENYVYVENVIESFGSDRNLIDMASRCLDVLNNRPANKFIFDTVDCQKVIAVDRLVKCINDSRV